MTETMTPDEVAGLAENLNWGAREFALAAGVDEDEILTSINFDGSRTYFVGIRHGATDEQVAALKQAVEEVYDCASVEQATKEMELIPDDPDAGTEETTELGPVEVPHISYESEEMVTTEFGGVRARLGGRC